MNDNPSIVRTDGCFATVSGTFYRAVPAGCEQRALSGSYGAGRYSRPDQPTLYLSASRAGVAAAMIAHRARGSDQVVLDFAVQATRIFDLRSPEARKQVLDNAGDPFCDWQALAASGGEPSSWRVRDWIADAGADGLIDPSRKAPGLWHLVLFRWNVPGASIVR